MKTLMLVLVAVMPMNRVRIFLYRWLMGYSISWEARVAPFTILRANQCDLGAVRIGSFNYVDVGDLMMADGACLGRLNRIKWISVLKMGSHSVIRSNNSVSGTYPGISPYKEFETFLVGDHVTITNRHLFDVSDSIEIGDNVTIAGSATQLWTHGFDWERTKIQAPIKIGTNVYIGSRSIVLQGVTIADRVSVGAGTTISKSLVESGFYVSSEVIRKGDLASYGEHERTVEHKGFRFLRKTG